MTAAVDRMDEPRADVGWIVGATVNVLRLRALDLALIALPFVWLPNALVGLLPQELANFRLTGGLPGLVFFGGASLIAVQEITGAAHVTALQATGVGLRRCFTLFMVNAVSTLIAFGGLLLLVVPGIFVLVAFMSATAVAVAEHKGSTAALERSWMLSRGSRGRLAGLLGIAVVAYLSLLLAGALIEFVVQFVAGTSWVTPVGQFLIAPAITTLLLTATTVGSAAAYVNLRSVREGSLGVADTFA